MSILFNSVSRRNLLDLDAPAKWYASVRSIEQVTERELAQRATEDVTLSALEMEMAFYQCQKHLVYGLLDGKTVHLRDLGTFYITCNSNGVDTEEEVTADIIEKLNIRFRPTPELRAKLAKAHMKRMERLLSGKKKPAKQTP